MAKSTGVWLGENLDDESEARFGEKINSGGESYVYLVDANTVQKNRSTVGFVQLEHAFNSVFIHNALFPSSAYKVNGVGISYDEFTIQLEQPYVKGEHPEQREIDAYMQSIGFEKNPYSKSNTSYYNKDLDITVEDLKLANVIKTGETLTITLLNVFMLGNFVD